MIGSTYSSANFPVSGREQTVFSTVLHHSKFDNTAHNSPITKYMYINKNKPNITCILC